MIKIKNLDKHFGGVYAVHNCSMEIKKSIITSIIGPNGAGKTTLFNLICGILKPDSGEVFFNSEKITGLQPYKIARAGISRTFQQAKLFKNLSVKDNLLAARQATSEELDNILEKVHCSAKPGTAAGELSYGQARLVEIARALLKPHILLMLDEPTAGVNPKVRQQLKKILLHLKKEGSTVLLIEHDMEFVMSISDEVIVMAEGSVLAKGTPKQVQNDKRVMEAYLGK